MNPTLEALLTGGAIAMSKPSNYFRRLDRGRQCRRSRLHFERLEDRVVLSAATEISSEFFSLGTVDSSQPLMTRADILDRWRSDRIAAFDISSFLEHLDITPIAPNSFVGSLTTTATTDSTNSKDSLATSPSDDSKASKNPVVDAAVFSVWTGLSENGIAATSQAATSLSSIGSSQTAINAAKSPATSIVQADSQGGYLEFASGAAPTFSADFVALDGAHTESFKAAGADADFDVNVSLHFSGAIADDGKGIVVVTNSSQLQAQGAGDRIEPTGVYLNSGGLVLYDAVPRSFERIVVDPTLNLDLPKDAVEKLAKTAEVAIFDPDEGLRTKSGDAPAIVGEEFDPIFGVPPTSGRPERLQAAASAQAADAEHVFAAADATTSISPFSSFTTTSVADEMPRSSINLAMQRSNAAASVERGRPPTEPSPPSGNGYDGGAVPVSEAVAETQRALDAELFEALAGSHVDGGRRIVASHQTDEPLTSELARSVAFDLAGAAFARIDAMEGMESPQAGLAPAPEAATTDLPSSSTPQLSRESERELAFARWPVLFAASTGALLFDRWRRKRPDGEPVEQRPRL